MKTLRLFSMLAVLCVPAVAGDIQNPGYPLPPPPACTENCTAANTDESTVSDLTFDLLLDLLIP